MQPKFAPLHLLASTNGHPRRCIFQQWLVWQSSQSTAVAATVAAGTAVAIAVFRVAIVVF